MSEQYSRIAVVTGASSGIGEATARRFVAAGFAVLGNARSADKLRELENELGEAFAAVPGDATDTAVVDRLFDTAGRRFGRDPDIVVVNAGRGLGGSVSGADVAQFEEVLGLNVTGALALMKRAAGVLRARQESTFPDTAADIVVIGSVVGRNISPFSAAYGATKAAVHSLAEGLRRELADCGVRVTLVEPGAVLSGFQAGAGYSDEMVQGFKDNFGPLLEGADVADTLHYIVTRPAHVHVCDLMVRPVRQQYP